MWKCNVRERGPSKLSVSTVVCFTSLCQTLFFEGSTLASVLSIKTPLAMSILHALRQITSVSSRVVARPALRRGPMLLLSTQAAPRMVSTTTRPFSTTFSRFSEGACTCPIPCSTRTHASSLTHEPQRTCHFHKSSPRNSSMKKRAQGRRNPSF